MTSEKMQNLIDTYALFVTIKGQLATKKKVDTKRLRAEVGPHKEEIIAYIRAQKKAEYDAAMSKANQRTATFEAIPGVAEIREARRRLSEQDAALTRMVESGSSTMQGIDAPTLDEMAALEARYPDAVYALKVQKEAQTTRNDELYDIWNDAYDALRDGQDPQTVKAETDERLASFTAAHAWA